MELFLPSFLILLLASVIVFTVIPRFGPHVLTVIAVLLLLFGARHHWTMFHSEYRLATWYTPLKQVAPAIILILVFLFILGYALTFFGGSGVPVPAVPELTGAVSSITDTAASAVGNITNTVKNVAVQAVNTVNKAANKAVNVVSGNTGGLRNSFRRNNSIFNIGSLPNKLP
jgi:hypothetical protein